MIYLPLSVYIYIYLISPRCLGYVPPWTPRNRSLPWAWRSMTTSNGSCKRFQTEKRSFWGRLRSGKVR